MPLARAFLHNAAHVFVYGLLAAALLLALDRGWRWPRRDGWLAVLMALAYGAVDEWHQSWVPGRAASWADLAADLAGAVIAVLVLRGWFGGDRAARRWLLVALAGAVLAVALATLTPW